MYETSTANDAVASIKEALEANEEVFDLSDFSPYDLELLSQALRDRILEVVSKNGGHLSSSLGAVELIVGMHKAFDPLKNPFIFDVSHQMYAHKLLTGRFRDFETLRQFGGISGFSKPNESKSDYFVCGHSSTSISLAVGVAKSNAIKGNLDRYAIALIGDGAMSAGLAYEAFNELGYKKYKTIIILNDNEMSISKPIGAISKYLSQALLSRPYQGMKDGVKKLLSKMPQSATYLAKRLEDSFKLITPGQLFEALGLEYIGPIDGHNIEEITNALNIAKSLNTPVIIHAQTTKGKGYELAEGPLEKWHGVGPFDIISGESLSAQNSLLAPTKVFSECLIAECKKDDLIVGLTAAMPTGTGLDSLINEFPSRFFDVGIAEQHAVCSAASMAKEGLKVVVAIYSTFLQRAFDQLIHDVGIMSLPVKFAIDRGGLVGEDGETHQGLFDVAYFRMIPNFIVFAPRDNESLKEALKFALQVSNAPTAFRYVRGAFLLDKLKQDDEDANFSTTAFALGKLDILIQNSAPTTIIGYGNGVGRAYQLHKDLKLAGIASNLVDLRFVKPLSLELIDILRNSKNIMVFSDSHKSCGVASAIGEFASEYGIYDFRLFSFEIEDKFIEHGGTNFVEKQLFLDKEAIFQKALNFLGH